MKVFVSHAAHDARAVNDLLDALRLRLPGVDFFVSSGDSIRPGAEWWKSIGDSLHAATVLLAVCSEHSMTRPWLFFEAGAAWANGISVLPVVIDEMSLSNVPLPLGMFQAVRIANRKSIGRVAERLLELLGIQNLDDVAENSEQVHALLRSPGIYLHGRYLAIDSGWVRYSGSLRPRTVRGAVEFGCSFIDAFRFPPDGRLGCSAARWIYIRTRIATEFHFYICVRLASGTERKLYLATTHAEWGYGGSPGDEFRVPIGEVHRNRWVTFEVDMQSFVAHLGEPVQWIDGFCIRGGPQISHVAVVTSPYPPRAGRGHPVRISYPG